jgi:hypothetical protein
MKAKSSKRMAGIIMMSRKSIAKDGVVTVCIIICDSSFNCLVPEMFQ